MYENIRRLDSAYDNTPITFVNYGTVVSINDEKGLGRIKVRIKGAQTIGGDDGKSDSDLPWSYPLLPKHLSVVPKIGENVFVFVFEKAKQHVDRLYIGPIISQETKLEFDNGPSSAMAPFTFGPQEPSVNPERISDVLGVFPKKDEVSIQGRYNTDITQKNNEIVLRAGKFVTVNKSPNNPFGISFNTKTQAYLQLKNGVDINDEKGSVANIVANKINLLTYKDGSPIFNLADKDDLITSSELNKILTEAHPIPFGDVLIEYLILLKQALFSHVHNGNGNPATDLTASGNQQSLTIFKNKAEDLEKAMLSKNIKIN